MLKKYLLLILFILLVFVSSDILAQPPGAVPPPDTPIDGSLGILLAFGVGYAVKKIRDKR